MPLAPPSDWEPAEEISPAPHLSRRAFLSQLTTLAATAGLLPSSAALGWDTPPPLMLQPRWPLEPSARRRYDYAPRVWRQPSRPVRDYPPPLRPWAEPWTAADLNTRVEDYIKGLRQTGRLRPDERTAWLVYDFTSRRFLVKINTSLSYQSASMIKPFIALAFFEKVRQGQLDYTGFHQQRMEAMIQHSNNHATNYFIDLLDQTSHRSGPSETEHTLRRRYPSVFRQTRIVEYIPNTGRTYRNRASALDYHRFLQALWYDQLPYADEIRRLMYLPNRDRVYTGARGVPRGTEVIDKTGSTARLCGDMGILIAQGRDGRQYPYTFIGIIQKARPTSNYGPWQRARGNVIREVSNMTYAHLRELYDLV